MANTLVGVVVGLLAALALEWFREIRAIAREKRATEQGKLERLALFQRETILEIQDSLEPYMVAARSVSDCLRQVEHSDGSFSIVPELDGMKDIATLESLELRIGRLSSRLSDDQLKIILSSMTNTYDDIATAFAEEGHLGVLKFLHERQAHVLKVVEVSGKALGEGRHFINI